MPKNKGRGGARQSAATPGASTSTATGPIASTSVAPDPVLEVKIFCWVLDLSKSAFSVTIEDNLTVDDLKTAIRNKKQALAEVDADDLTLWKVICSPFSLICPCNLKPTPKALYRGIQSVRASIRKSPSLPMR